MTPSSPALPPLDGRGAPAFDVEADLTVEVDGGADGHAWGRLTGDGRRLRLVVDRPEVLTGSTGRGMVRAVAARLAALDLHVEVHGPRGRIATLDPARNSRLSALVVGSPHIAFAPAAWPLALRTGTPGLSRRGVAVVLSAVAGVALTWGLTRRPR
ncbi:MAG TPA: hypothetical protein VGE11_00255 [Pseudonocardia sp.]